MKNGRKMLGVLLLFLVAGVLWEAKTVLGAQIVIRDPEQYVTGTRQSVEMQEKQRECDYQFSLSASGKLDIDITAYMDQTSYYICDRSGNILWEKEGNPLNPLTVQMRLEDSVDLTDGIYYFKVVGPAEGGKFQFGFTFTSAQESFQETDKQQNNTKETAVEVKTDVHYKGQIALNDKMDMYKVTLPESGCLNVSVNARIYESNYRIFDENDSLIWERNGMRKDSMSDRLYMEEPLYLAAGTYYFVIEGTTTGSYDMLLGYVQTNETFKETMGGSNNTMAAASEIVPDTDYTAQIMLNDKEDYYRFELKDNNAIRLTMQAWIHSIDCAIYTADGSCVWKRDGNLWDETTRKMTLDEKICLGRGVFYLNVHHNDGYGIYNMKIAAYEENISIHMKNQQEILAIGKEMLLLADVYPAELANKNIIWTSSNTKTVEVVSGGAVRAKAAGAAIVTAQAEADPNGKGQTVVVVTPDKAKVKKIALLSSKKNRKVIRCKAGIAGKCDGYQFSLSDNKAMKKAKKKVSKKSSVTCLVSFGKKSKRCFVKVRAYTEYKGKKYYGKWSAVKRKKIMC